MRVGKKIKSQDNIYISFFCNYLQNLKHERLYVSLQTFWPYNKYIDFFYLFIFFACATIFEVVRFVSHPRVQSDRCRKTATPKSTRTRQRHLHCEPLGTEGSAIFGLLLDKTLHIAFALCLLHSENTPQVLWFPPIMTYIV